MATCQTCARFYDPKSTSSPFRYCSHECYDFGAKSYNKSALEQFSRLDAIKDFAVKLIDQMHWLHHSNDDRFDCEWDICVEAKILGL